MLRRTLLTLCCALGLGTAAAAAPGPAPHAAPPHGKGSGTHRARVGKASIYARKFAGRKMADGTRMDPRADNAASKTLPLGTVAQVTNLDNGKSTVVTIQDRGPHVPGRIVDLSPGSAEKIGLTKQSGLAPVEVKPIALPAADGERRPPGEVAGMRSSTAGRRGG